MRGEWFSCVQYYSEAISLHMLMSLYVAIETLDAFRKICGVFLWTGRHEAQGGLG